MRLWDVSSAGTIDHWFSACFGISQFTLLHVASLLSCRLALEVRAKLAHNTCDVNSEKVAQGILEPFVCK